MNPELYLQAAALPFANRDMKSWSDLRFGEIDFTVTRMQIMLDHFRMVLRATGRQSAETDAACKQIEITKTHAERAITLDKFGLPACADHPAAAATHHDVKANEMVLREIVQQYPALAPHVELVHFAATSEDMSNIAWAVLHRRAAAQLHNKLVDLEATLVKRSYDTKGIMALGHTHGQPATPTSYGARFAVAADTIGRAGELLRMAICELSAKCSGPTGGNNAAEVAIPHYASYAEDLIRSYNLKYEMHAHQCSNYSATKQLLSAIAAVAGAAQYVAEHLHEYISCGELIQAAGEYGSPSSVMPQKINPHGLESARGHAASIHAACSNAIAQLSTNPGERELHTHVVERGYAGIYAASCTMIGNIMGTLQSATINADAVARNLRAHPEVVAEAFNTLGRLRGIPNIYNKVRDAMLRARGDPGAVRNELQALTALFPEPHCTFLESIVADPTLYRDYTAPAYSQMHPIRITGPGPTPKPLVIFNLNQTLLNSMQFLIDNVNNYTTVDPEFECNRISNGEIMSMMRSRMDIHEAFAAWFGPESMRRISMYFSRCVNTTCGGNPCAAMPCGPRTVAKLSLVADVHVLTNSGATSAERRLRAAGYTDFSTEVPCTRGRLLYIIDCNPTKTKPIQSADQQIIDKLLVRRYILTGLYSREECAAAGYDDQHIIDSLAELIYIVK